jgi:hypothetical protein
MPVCRRVVILARRADLAAPSCAADIPRLGALLRFSRCPLSAQNWSARLPGEQVLSPRDGTTLDRSRSREKVVEIRELIALLNWLQTPELSLKTPSVFLAGVNQ